MVDAHTSSQTDDDDHLASDFVHLARLAMDGRRDDVAVFLRRSLRRLGRSRSDLAVAVERVLLDTTTHRPAPLRRQAQPTRLPGDRDRSDLVRVERPQRNVGPLILSSELRADLEQLVAERNRRDQLAAVGLSPARTALLVGPPGVGKTLSARWIASQLETSLVILDLASVMSSMLGRTGANIADVFQQARQIGGVLLLDELDAIAKRRHDDLDVGELKRLVTVLLQQLDDWPAEAGLVLGATNHPELLDPAAWRRFDVVLTFPLPDHEALVSAVEQYAEGLLDESLIDVVARSAHGLSFNDIEREVAAARRRAVLSGRALADVLLDSARVRIARLPHDARRKLAVDLSAHRVISQRQASEITGVSRDTIRKASRPRCEE